MPIMIDLNVILDVMQKREPHYHASADVLNRIVTGEFRAFVPGHALTTLHYILTKYDCKQKANETIDWLLRYFEVAGEEKAVFLQARILPLSDFEDAVVASTAKACGCQFIITRNVADFRGSPVAAITPEEFLVAKHV